MSDTQPVEILITVPTTRTDNEYILSLVKAQADGIRLIAKGTTPQNYIQRYKELNEMVKAINPQFRIIIDLPGFKPLVGPTMLPHMLRSGEKIMFSDNPGMVTPDSVFIPTVGLMQYKQSLQKGHRILAADGVAVFEITAVAEDHIEAVSRTEGFELTPNRSMNLPDSQVVYEALSEMDNQMLQLLKDVQDICISVSMVSSAQDLQRVKSVVPHAKTVAKVETSIGVNNIEEIAREADEVMVARGDLGIELPPEDLLRAQDEIVRVSQDYGKPVMVATRLLYSLETADAPSEADLRDIRHIWEQNVRSFLISGNVSQTKPYETLSWLRRILDGLNKAE